METSERQASKGKGEKKEAHMFGDLAFHVDQLGRRVDKVFFDKIALDHQST